MTPTEVTVVTVSTVTTQGGVCYLFLLQTVVCLSYDNDDDLNDRRVKSGQPNSLCPLSIKGEVRTRSRLCSRSGRVKADSFSERILAFTHAFTTVVCGLSAELKDISRPVEWF